MNMSQQWTTALAVLAVLAACLWTADTSWTANWLDALPALAGVALFCWLGRPWRLRQTRQTPPLSLALVGTATLCIGAAGQLLLLGAVGWTCLLACVLLTFVEPNDDLHWSRLLPLAVLGFPWLAFQSPWLGWWFRWTGAVTAEAVLTALQMDIVREGTQLWSGAVCISVGQACSGLQGLQAMLIAGSFVALETLPNSRRYWWHLPILFAAAWVANAARVTLTAVGAGHVPLHWIEGDAHWWQGWLLLCLMFVICQSVFRAMGSETQLEVAAEAKA